jgi:hypothetical protein
MSLYHFMHVYWTSFSGEQAYATPQSHPQMPQIPDGSGRHLPPLGYQPGIVIEAVAHQPVPRCMVYVDSEPLFRTAST